MSDLTTTEIDSLWCLAAINALDIRDVQKVIAQVLEYKANADEVLNCIGVRKCGKQREEIYRELMELEELFFGWIQEHENTSGRVSAYGDCRSQIKELAKKYKPEDGGK